VNPPEYLFEFGLEGVACVGYSFKNFFECGVLLSSNNLSEDNNKEMLKLIEQRKRRVLKTESKRMSYISYS